jgi:hypothetical protein
VVEFLSLRLDQLTTRLLDQLTSLLPDAPEWLAETEAQRLLTLGADANVAGDLARHHLGRIIGGLGAIRPRLEAHRRVRRATKATGITQRIEPKLPVEVLGVYVYLPAG